MKKQMIAISINQKPPGEEKVEAFVFDVLAVHKPHPLYPNKYEGRYIITHIKSGRTFGLYGASYSLNEVIRNTNNLLKEDINWEFNEDISETDRVKVFKILKFAE